MAERLKVRRLGGKHWAWCVEGRSGRILPAHGWLARFHTHAEAIAYADRMARTNQGENNE